MLAGLGARAELDAERARVVAALAHRRARELGAQTLCWELPPGAGDEIAEGLVQGTLLGAYRFDRYKRTAAGGADDDSDDDAGLQRLLISAGRDIDGSVVTSRDRHRPRRTGPVTSATGRPTT